MDGSLAQLINLYLFPTGRRIFALSQVQSLAKSQGFPELAKHCAAAVASDRACLSLERKWSGLVTQPSKDKKPAALDASQIDPLVDRTLTAIRDHAVNQTAGAAADDPIHATVADFIGEIFPGGVDKVTGLAYVLELAAVEDILKKLQEKKLAAVVKELGLGRLVARLTELTAKYAAALKVAPPDTLAFGDVRAARGAGHDLLLQTVAMVLGKYPSGGGEDVAQRAILLQPIFKQNDDIAASLRGRKAPVDVNPETGTPEPNASPAVDPAPAAPAKG